MIGTLVDGRYKLTELLGSGQAFDSYRALGEGGSEVLVKVLRETLADDRDLLIRLRARLRKVAARSSREIVPLLFADPIMNAASDLVASVTQKDITARVQFLY